MNWTIRMGGMLGLGWAAICFSAAGQETLENLQVTGAALEGAYYDFTLGPADLVSNYAGGVNASLVKIYRANAGVSNFPISSTLVANTGPRVAQGPNSSQAIILYAWNTERDGDGGPPSVAPTASYTLTPYDGPMARVDLVGIGSGNFHRLPCFMVFLQPPSLVKSYWTYASHGRLDYMTAYADGLNPFAKIQSLRLDGVAMTRILGDWETPVPAGSYVLIDPQDQAFAVDRDNWGFDEIRKFIRCYDWGFTRPNFRIRFPANLSDGPHTLTVVATPFSATDVDCQYYGKYCQANVKGTESYDVALELQSGDTNYIWYGASDLVGGWKWLDWFGSFNDPGNGWIFHSEHGWMYAGSAYANSAWFWTADLGWLWTSRSQYPFLYRNSVQSWLWYQKGSKNPRWFRNLTTGQWESH